MDVLKDKQYTKYNYISRYATFPFYYNTEDKKYVYGITSYLNDSITYVAYTVKAGDTLEQLANYHYGRPDYYWVIADYNKITDPFAELKGTIRIPNLNSITFKK